jgi:hypothetical protein
MMIGTRGGMLHIDLELAYGDRVTFESAKFPIHFLYVPLLILYLLILLFFKVFGIG